MIQLESADICVSIKEMGAELCSVFHKNSGKEFMWKGDPAYWGKHSPVLFPIVGALKENTYYYKNQPYILPRHGFARERVFAVLNQSERKVTLLLKEDETSLKIYPFPFELRITYSLENNCLQVRYQVKNTGGGLMYFSLGAHPAFAVPFDGGNYGDYFLEFEKTENAPRWPISADGLIEEQPVGFFHDENRLKLTKELFMGDALVFKGLKSGRISVMSVHSDAHLDFEFRQFPYFGIWAAKQANFVCLEPWCGIADSVHTDQQLVHKEGINKLDPGTIFEREWKLCVSVQGWSHPVPRPRATG